MLKARLRPEETDRLLSPLSRLGLHPTTWTLLSLVPAVGGFLALAGGSLPGGLLLFALAGFMDMIDGAVARSTNQASTSGAFIDGVLDRYVEVLLILGLAFYLGDGVYLGLHLEYWFIILIFGSIMTSFVRAYADHRGLVKEPGLLKAMGGLMERGERLAALYTGMALGIYSHDLLVAAVILVAILSNLTAAQRIAFAVQHGRQ